MVDTGPLVAFLSKRDDGHELAFNYFKATAATLVTNVAVLTEAAYLLSRSPGAASDLLRWVSKTFLIDTETAADLPRILDIMAKYVDLPADFADASLLAVCERRGIGEIATFDKDFEVYETTSGSKLQNAFRDP